MKPESIKVIEGKSKSAQSVRLSLETHGKLVLFAQTLGAELGFEPTLPQTIGYLLKRSRPLKIETSPLQTGISLRDTVIPLTITRQLVDDVLDIINRNGGRDPMTPSVVCGKIDAIKHVRMITSLGLKEAKDEVEIIISDAIASGKL